MKAYLNKVQDMINKFEAKSIDWKKQTILEI